MDKPPLIVLLGPTASGKSTLALQLAPEFDGYIISADSRQVYRGMDIGTAKPTEDERRRVHHYLLNVVDPNERFTLFDYQKTVREVLDKQSGLPFLVGGTGLYIDAVVENWDIPAGEDATRRTELDALPLADLVARLRSLDPDSSAVVDLKNKRRIIRALEVAEETGGSFVRTRRRNPSLFRTLKLGTDVPREELVERINRRADDMMKRGLLDETKRLGAKYGWDSPALSSLGYRQLGAHLRGELSLDEAVERIKIETRQYAKRQMTWFRRDTTIQWIRTAGEAREHIKAFLK